MVDLEHFPTSESAKKMLETISGGFYDKSYVGKWIFQVMGLEWDEAKNFVDQLKDQVFPETATWGLRYHEEKHGLPNREGLSDEVRRKYIYQKRDDHPPINPEKLSVMLKNYTNADVYVSEQDCPPYTFKVTMEGDKKDINVKELMQELNKLKPSHLSYELFLIPHKAYRNTEKINIGAFITAHIKSKLIK